MIRVTQFSAAILLVSLAAGCVSTGSDVPAVTSFADSVSQFDVVPPGWITADGRSLGAGQDPSGVRVAFAFPSLPTVRVSRTPLHVDVPGFFRPNTWFQNGTFVRLPATEIDQAVEIRTARLDQNLVVDIDAASMAQIHRLDWEQFRGLQAAYLSWLYAQSSCWSIDCFSNESALSLRDFWRNHVLKDATFARFAASYLNPPPPVSLKSKGGGNMLATQIFPRQQLAITWGNQNFYPGTSSTPLLGTSYSRITSGGTTRLQIVSDAGLRLFPTPNCRIRETREFGIDPGDTATLPFPETFKTLFSNWVMPVYNLFDLHNPRLLTIVDLNNDRLPCPDRARKAPPHLFLLAPSYYIKPDTSSEIARAETDSRVPTADTQDEFLSLTRQFVILACNVADRSAVADEWKRMLDTASGNPQGHNPRCGKYLHGLFAGKAFVELRNRFSIDGRLVEDGILHFSTVGQALGPSLGTRANVEAAPGSGALLDLWRASPWRQDGSVQQRVRVRFFTTMSDILDQAIVLEGDDLHVISISEMLR